MSREEIAILCLASALDVTPDRLAADFGGDAEGDDEGPVSHG